MKWQDPYHIKLNTKTKIDEKDYTNQTLMQTRQHNEALKDIILISLSETKLKGLILWMNFKN